MTKKKKPDITKIAKESAASSAKQKKSTKQTKSPKPVIAKKKAKAKTTAKTKAANKAVQEAPVAEAPTTETAVKLKLQLPSNLLSMLTLVILSCLLITGLYVAQIYQIQFIPKKAAPTQSISSLTKVADKPKKTTNINTALATSLAPLQQCKAGTTDVIVAHEDDDLLFMNLELANAIAAGTCIRSTYMTAGDSGHASEYWKERESGIERAYAYMANAENVWTSKSVKLHGHTVSVRYLAGHPSISLLFVRLPDGSPKGQGFASTRNVSLQALADKKIDHISTVDDASDYTYQTLMTLVATILTTDQPDHIYSQVAFGPLSSGDHSDHRQVGKLVLAVRDIIAPETKITAFVGYPSGRNLPNMSEDQAFAKRQIFMLYAGDDTEICNAATGCRNESTYLNYFSRIYSIQE